MAKLTSNGSVSNSSSSKSSSKNRETSNSGSLSYKAIFFMTLLSIQFGIQPIVTQKYTSKTIIRSTVVFMQEVVKLAISIIGISLGNISWVDVTSGWTITSWLRLALLPATIYLIQNMCSLIAYQNLDAITYNVLNQTKTLSAAFCCYLLMKKKQSSVQMMALLLLLLAALVMEKIVPLDTLMLPYYWISSSGMDDTGNNNDDVGSSSSIMSNLSGRHFTHGVVPIMVASFLSGLAGAITQKSLQVGNRNALLFTIELCVASILLLLVSFLSSDDGKKIKERGFFDEWTIYTCVPILTNSAGGILVGLVIKYAGTVRKGFALIFGILLSGAVQSLLDENKSLSKEDVAGGILAAISLWMHSTHSYVAAAAKKEKIQ